MCVCVPKYVCVCVFKCVGMNVYVYEYVCLHVCMCVYVSTFFVTCCSLLCLRFACLLILQLEETVKLMKSAEW